MLPTPDSLTLPIKEGIRDIRCSIRLEAESGTVSSGFFGAPAPTRHLAGVLDGALTGAEKFAGRLLRRDAGGLDGRLDRLAAGLASGAPVDARDLYGVSRCVLEILGARGFVISELRLSVQAETTAARQEADPTVRAVAQALRMAGLGFVRPCFPAAVLQPDTVRDAGLPARIALTVWLSVLVRAASGKPGHLTLAASSLAVDAEEDAWAGYLRDGRIDDLVTAWRHTVPYLP